jgi:hypothetical protein
MFTPIGFFASSIAGYGTPPSQDANCIIHWDFGNPASYPGSGTTVTDLKSFRNGTLTGAGYTYQSGVAQGVLQSSNKSSNIDIASLGATAYTGGTFEYLFKMYTTLSDDNVLLDWVPDPTVGQLNIQQFASPKRIQINMQGELEATKTVNFNTTFASSGWQHLVVTFGQSVPSTLYLNGTSLAASSNFGASDTFVWNTAGDIYGGGGGCIIAQFAVWRMYSVPLSGAEVLANYNFFETII